MDLPGSITLRPRVFNDLLRDINSLLHNHRFARFVFMNSHGGNPSSLEVLATFRDELSQEGSVGR